MKGMDILCSSNSAAIISMDRISSSGAEVGGRGIDRHNPMIRDGRRSVSNPPINPKPQKSSSSKKKKRCDTKPSVDKKKTASNSRRSFVSDLFTPPGSTRYLLSDVPFFDGYSDYEPPNNKDKNTQALGNQDHSSVSPHQGLVQEVVVLRVSLHCKGCEGKVRKHLSRMKGVTSFHIDYGAKKVTVTGELSPASVLASVSKVKAAQFWTTKSETQKYN